MIRRAAFLVAAVGIAAFASIRPAAAAAPLGTIDVQAAADPVDVVVDLTNVIGQQGPASFAPTAASFQTGPSTYAVAYPVWPGSYAGNPGTNVELFAPQLADAIKQAAGAPIPNLPRAESRGDSTNPPSSAKDTTIPGAVVTSGASATGSVADAAAQGTTASSALSFASGSSHSETSLKQDNTVQGMTTGSVHGFQAGPVSVKSVTTTLTGTSDGDDAKSSGGTVVQGLDVGGVPLNVDDTGVHLASQNVSAPGGKSFESAGAVLKTFGVKILPLTVTSTKSGSTATRTSSGLVIEVSSPSANLPPAGQLPAVGVGSVNLIYKLAPAAVSVSAKAGPPPDQASVAAANDSTGVPTSDVAGLAAGSTLPANAGGGVTPLGTTPGGGLPSFRQTPASTSPRPALSSSPVPAKLTLFLLAGSILIGARARRFCRSVVQRSTGET